MKFFGISPRLFEEPIGDLGGGGGEGETSLAVIPSGDPSPSSGDPAPAASGEPGTAVTRFTGHLYTDDNKVNPAARPILEQLRKDHPVFENRLRGVIHENRQLRAEFPGGIAEVRERVASLQSIIDNAGGETELSEARGELEFFHNLDQQFTAGDPRFIKAMIDAPGGQDAFLKLAPSMMAEYERIWPEGFANFVDGQLLDRLRNADFRVNLERLADFLAQLPEGTVRDNAASYWVAIRDFYNTLTASAKAKPAMPISATPAPVADTRSADLDRRERELKQKEFRDAGMAEIDGEFARQWKTLAKGTTAIMSHIRPAFDQRMKAALTADKSVDKAIQGYVSRGDVDGYRSYMRAQYAKNGARILKAELGHYRTGTPAAAPVVPGAAPVAGDPVAAKTEAGWTALNRRLTPAEYANVDLESTTRAMFAEGKAVMKNGQKVTFKR